MFFEVWDRMESAMKIVVCGLVVCLFIGPIMIIIGITLLAADNTRDQDVMRYNDAVSLYNKGDAVTLGTMQLFSGGQPMSRAFERITVLGEQKGVDPASHFIFSRPSVNRDAVADSYSIRFDRGENDTVGDLSWTVPWTAEVNRALFCNTTFCTSGCGEQQYKCESRRLQSHCEQMLRGVYQDFDGSCYENDQCGVCRYTGSLARACVVFKLDANNKPSVSSKYQSCYYPFTTHEYLPDTVTFKLEAMSESDPFIELQEITVGKNDFGLTDEQQRSAGVTLIIIGIILSAIVGGIVFFLLNREKNKQNDPNAVPQQQQAVAQPQVAAADSQEMQPQPQVYNAQPQYNVPPPQYQQQPYTGGYDPQPQHYGYPPQQQPTGYPPQQQPTGYPPQQPQYYGQQQPSHYEQPPPQQYGQQDAYVKNSV